MANPNGRPRSETVKLTKTARERFDCQLAEKLPDIFTALFRSRHEGQGHCRAVPPRQSGRASAQGCSGQCQDPTAVELKRMRRSIRRHPHSHRKRRADAG